MRLGLTSSLVEATVLAKASKLAAFTHTEKQISP